MRRTVQLPILSVRAIFRIPSPLPRSAITLASTATLTRGRPKNLSLRLGSLQSSLDSFNEHATLEFCEHHEHLEE